MPIFRLTRELRFPSPEQAEDGLLAVGGDLRPERLLLAYRSGIFPWYDERSPILWHSPDPRAVFVVEDFHVGRTLRKLINKGVYRTSVDTAFAEVIRHCKEAYRPGQRGTWITDEMEAAYVRLHELGYAHSVETWEGKRLVGGLYGVSIGRMFFGESMFSLADDASKVAYVALVEKVKSLGIRYIDSQVINHHTTSLGAVEWPREQYLRVLAEEIAAMPTALGPWT
jgi:leucyl/phenylalanyl-tRNA--protein transferase